MTVPPIVFVVLVAGLVDLIDRTRALIDERRSTL